MSTRTASAHMGQCLKRVLASKGMTQAELASKLHTSKQMVSYWVHAQQWSLTTLRRIASATGVPCSVFIAEK